MPTVLRNILAVIVGLVVGGAVNMSLVVLGPTVIPPPPGVDMTTAEGLAKGMPLLEAKHFVFPVLAFAVGVVFLAGGIAAAFVIPAPAWFIGLDLVAAYIPMAWLATAIGRRLKGPRGAAP